MTMPVRYCTSESEAVHKLDCIHTATVTNYCGLRYSRDVTGHPSAYSRLDVNCQWTGLRATYCKTTTAWPCNFPRIVADAVVVKRSIFCVKDSQINHVTISGGILATKRQEFGREVARPDLSNPSRFPPFRYRFPIYSFFNLVVNYDG